MKCVYCGFWTLKLGDMRAHVTQDHPDKKWKKGYYIGDGFV